MFFDTGHTLSGSFGAFTNPAIETGLITCRALLEFLAAKESKNCKHKDNVWITSFERPDGRNLEPVFNLRPCQILPFRSVGKRGPACAEIAVLIKEFRKKACTLAKRLR